MGNVRKKNGMMEFLSDKGWEPMIGDWEKRIVDMGDLDPDRYGKCGCPVETIYRDEDGCPKMTFREEMDERRRYENSRK